MRSAMLMWQGACWGALVNNHIPRIISSLQGTAIFVTKKQLNIPLGDCVGSVYFLNKEEFKRIRKDLGCPAHGEGYIIAIPYYEDEICGWNIFKCGKRWLKDAKRFWDERLGRIKPVCRKLEKPFSHTPKEPMLGPKMEGGHNAYCITRLDKDEIGYIIDYTPGRCEE